MKAIRRKIQVIFQDPYSSLNPRMTVGQIIGEPLHVYKLVADGRKVKSASRNCSNRSDCVRKWRRAIRINCPAVSASASALRARSRWSRPSSSATKPCRRSTCRSRDRSSTCWKTCSGDFGLAYLFIAHDLAVVRHISMRVVVHVFRHDHGSRRPRRDLPRRRLHPYTKVLLDAAPVPDPTIEKGREPRLIKGELPSHLSPPSGCVFNTRCPIASEECREIVPALEEKRPGHYAACIKV